MPNKFPTLSRLSRLLLFGLACTTSHGTPPSTGDRTLAIVGGTLVNPGRRPIANAVVIVVGNRIQCAGRATDCRIPEHAERIDSKGRFVAPGLIDAHVHFSQTGWVDGRPDAMDFRDTYSYDSVVAGLEHSAGRFGQAFLCSGVTSVMDVGGYPFTFRLAATSLARSDMPRVVAAGPLIVTFPPQPAHNAGFARQFEFAPGDSAARTLVQTNYRSGASVIKFVHLRLAGAAMGRARAALAATVEEATHNHLRVLVHATDTLTARDAVRAGAKVLVHIVQSDTVSNELIAEIKRKGVIVIPTLTVNEGYADMYRGRRVDARLPMGCLDTARRRIVNTIVPERVRSRGFAKNATAGQEVQRPTMNENVRRLYVAGVTIAFGTDAGNPGTPHGASTARELEAMQIAGMPAADVFRAATEGSAKAAGIAGEAGTIEPGKRADIVIFDGDPTQDISNVRRIRMVFRNGKVVAREAASLR